MKRSVIVRVAWLIVLGCTIAGGLVADERSAVWSRLYRRSRTLEGKLTLMENATRNPSEDLIPMLFEALDELNAMRDRPFTTTERLVHTDLSKTVVRTIGTVGAVEAKDMVFDIARNAEDMYLRGEAIYALGRLGALEYADDVAMWLRNFNLNLDTGEEDKVAEVLAYACVLALERFKAPVGYAPLFFASIGWYSPVSGVCEKARSVMDTLVDDPTDTLFDLVRLQSDPEVKLEALLAEERSDAPAEGKGRVAVEALRQSLIRVPANVSESTTFGRLRFHAMGMLIENGSTSEEAVGYLDEVMRSSLDINQRITAIVALGSMGTDEAISALVRYLKLQNERQLAGVTPEDYRIIRATIQVLGQTGSSLAVEELLAVGISDWPSSIVREADAALEAIQE